MIGWTVVAAAALSAGPLQSISAMQWNRRVLLVCAPDAGDAALERQRRMMAAWAAGAEARDVTIVEVIGGKVIGASDTADTLRRRYGIPTHGFTVILIGKDGAPKLRQQEPIPAAKLEQTIDAMPMRRAETR